ncbi:uncharacterized protein LOC129907894 [Episyrphus balteatus]|uniref:uncharacterized protein LOC129907894 n=1 Tax=Episyrphus balteatus TaxID=286459 RepID=UPI0024859B8F|nr:uncharacterized protein LOC129907894 [Episyrphus balteatus]
MMMAAGVLKLCESYKSFAMITQFLIVGVSVCICIVNAFDDNDYSNEPRDIPYQIHHQQQQLQQQQQQMPFSFENLQRLRAKLQNGAPYRYENNRNANSNQNNRNTYKNDQRIEPEEPAAVPKDQEISGVQKTHPNDNNQPKFNEMEFFDEFESNLPYGIQNVRRDLSSRSSRSQPLRMHKPKTTFQSLCPSKRLVIPLETIEYIYRPDHYEEVTCYHSYAPNRDYLSETNKVCSEAGFTCIQLNRTVYLTRRAKGSECWESETRIVPSGCECMWPKHTFGDIITYH